MLAVKARNKMRQLQRVEHGLLAVSQLSVRVVPAGRFWALVLFPENVAKQVHIYIHIYLMYGIRQFFKAFNLFSFIVDTPYTLLWLSSSSLLLSRAFSGPLWGSGWKKLPVEKMANRITG